MCGQAHEPTGAYTLTKYGLQVSHITWELVRNAESQFQVCTNTHLTHWLYWIRICFEIALGDNSCTYQFEKGCSSKASSSHTSKIFPRLEQGSDHPLLSVALLSYISPGHVLQTSWLVVNCFLLAHLLPRLEALVGRDPPLLRVFTVLSAWLPMRQALRTCGQWSSDFLLRLSPAALASLFPSPFSGIHICIPF